MCKIEVEMAEPFRPETLYSLGSAEYMLIRQFKFPKTYDKHLDVMTSADSDRLYQWDYDHASRVFKEHTGTGDQGLMTWARGAFDKDILKFIIAALKVDPLVKWTGYRILGTVHRGNGFSVFSLQLFAKGAKSKTKVYSGDFAPNVKSIKGTVLNAYGEKIISR